MLPPSYGVRAPHPARSSIGRRGFMAGAGAGAVLLGTSAWTGSPAWSAGTFPSNPFTLGVASGDPMPNSVVLWTRLAVDPYAADGKGGIPDRDYQVDWEIATDESFRKVVRRGTATASPQLGHSVHPEVWGLGPGREYFYRFKAGGEISPVGRTKTAPAYGSMQSLDFAFASCSNFAAGYFAAYRHLAEENVDLIVHLGDYLYEYGMDEFGGKRQLSTSIGTQFAGEMTDLARYRLQYGLYKSDPDLMAAHASAPFILTFDDHEIENNWAGDIPEASSQTPGEAFLPRRAASFQAYYENLPLRAAQLPDGPDIQLYRTVPYGRLLEFNVLDTRQYRDDQAYGDGVHAPGPETDDPNRTMMGWEQEDWLQQQFQRSHARWQVLANQAPMAETDRDPGEGKLVWTDPWDGYTANRRRLLEGAQQAEVDNLVVITGDRHTNYVNDVLVEYGDPDGEVLATEFVGTSITSGGNGSDMLPVGEQYLASNPHMKFFNAQRGYVRCRVTPETFTSDYRVVPYVEGNADAPISTRASWVVENGRPGAVLGSEGKRVGTKFARQFTDEAELDARRAGDRLARVR